MVYVDDFKMAGPAGNLEKGWQTITSGIKLVGIGPVSTYLGCEHATFSGHVDAKPVLGIQYKMQPFMESCVEAYRKVVGKPDLHLPRVDTPFLADAGGGNAPVSREDEWKHYPREKAWCRIHHNVRCAMFTPVRVSGGGRILGTSCPTGWLDSALLGSQGPVAETPRKLSCVPRPRTYGVIQGSRIGCTSPGMARHGSSRKAAFSGSRPIPRNL